MSAVRIHPTAIVAQGAEIDSGCEVGPYSIIGAKVKIGAGTVLHSHVVIDGNTEIGNNNTFFQFASIGAAPQDQKYHGEDSKLIIGDHNIVREYVTLQPGTEVGGMLTEIKDHNLFMANSHVAHDVKIASNCWFANSVAVAGHVNVSDYVIVGGLSGIHQFVNLGSHAMIAAGSMVSKDVPPFCNAQGDRAGLVGINKIGLSRRGFSEQAIAIIEKTYRQLFYSEGIFSDRLKNILEDSKLDDNVKGLCEFIKASHRGICFPRKKNQEQE